MSSSKIDCCGCTACASICPSQCIEMVEDREGFLYPQRDQEHCINCGLCQKVCPALPREDHAIVESFPIAYAAINKSDEERMQSSSGGIFSLLAEEILSRNGVVFGAAFSEDCTEVLHIPIETKDDLYKLRGSKYLQSKMGDSYSICRKYLEMGREVLFSGTPCQIEGLRAFLQKEYENLLCIDIICHGVPSPKIWRKYIQFREAWVNDKVVGCSFRDKRSGWKKYSVLVSFANENEYCEMQAKDLYMQAFLSNACLRPSCSHCHYKKVRHVSDITLADFWGIQQVFPEMNDDKGTSLVIVQSQKGETVFEILKNNTIYQKVDVLRALKSNPTMIKSAKAHSRRNAFFQNMDKLPFNQLVEEYARPRKSLKNVLGRIKHVLAG